MTRHNWILYVFLLVIMINAVSCYWFDGFDKHNKNRTIKYYLKTVNQILSTTLTFLFFSFAYLYFSTKYLRFSHNFHAKKNILRYICEKNRRYQLILAKHPNAIVVRTITTKIKSWLALFERNLFKIKKKSLESMYVYRTSVVKTLRNAWYWTKFNSIHLAFLNSNVLIHTW